MPGRVSLSDGLKVRSIENSVSLMVVKRLGVRDRSFLHRYFFSVALTGRRIVLMLRQVFQALEE